MFGRSYNTQFKVVLGFTLLNFLVAIVLAVVRKRKGVFGKIPVRRLGNEFTGEGDKTEEEKESKEGVVEGREDEGAVSASKGSD